MILIFDIGEDYHIGIGVGIGIESKRIGRTDENPPIPIPNPWFF